MSKKTELDFAFDTLDREPDALLFPVRFEKRADGKITKKPAITGRMNGTRDRKQLRQWWTTLRGRIHFAYDLEKMNCLVVDVDKKEGAPGFQQFAALAAEHDNFPHDAFPETMKVETPSGGEHWHYKGLWVFALGKQGFGEGIDSPWWVPIPGTVNEHTGKAYKLVVVRKRTEKPDWFVSKLRKRERVVDADQVPVVPLDTADNIAWYVRYLKNEAPMSIEGSGGEKAMLDVAAIGKDHGISRDMTVQLIDKHYNFDPEFGGKCDPSWSSEELAKKVDNAFEYLIENAPGEATPEHDFAGTEDEDKREEAKRKELAEIEDTAERERQQAPLNKDDFLFWMTGKSRGYICIPLATDGLDDKKLWVADSVDMKLPSVTYIDPALKKKFKTDEAAKAAGHKYGLYKTEFEAGPDGQPVEVIKRRDASHHVKYNPRQQVGQVTWWPGKPSVLYDTVLEKDGVRKKKDVHVWNYYLPPVLDLSKRASSPDRWLNHTKMLYPDDWKHIVMCCAWRVQRPDVKIHHAVLAGGASRIGKDTIFKPVRYAIGASNFSTVEAHDIMDSPQNNKYLAAVFCLITEVEDFGDENRYVFYKRTKPWLGGTATGTLPIADKYIRRHEVIDVVFVVATTNEMFRGLFIPGDDTRWYVAWSPFDWRADYKTEDDYFKRYIVPLYRWMYQEGGNQAVAHYLKKLPLDGSALDYPFDPKQPPPRTRAWHEIVRAHQEDEDNSLTRALTELGDPAGVTVSEVNDACRRLGISEPGETGNRAEIPAAFAAVGYRHEGTEKGENWAVKIGGKTVKLTVYVRRKLSVNEAVKAAQEAIAREKARRILRPSMADVGAP